MSVLSDAHFFHRIVHDGEQTMILSSCELCGAQRKCPADPSLQEWEQTHRCPQLQPSVSQNLS